MGKRVRVLALAMLSLPMITAIVSAQEIVPTDVQPADLMRLAQFGDPRTTDWNDRRSQLAVFSPDNRHVAIVVRRGDPETQTNVSELLVYRVDDLDRAEARPLKTVRFASTTIYQPVAFVRWADARTLTFLASADDAPPSIYAQTLDTPAPVLVLRTGYPIAWYDLTDAGRRIVGIEARGDGAACVAALCRISAERFDALDFAPLKDRFRLLTAQLDHPAVRGLDAGFPGDGGIADCELTLSPSPTGRYAVQNCRPTEAAIAGWWGDYGAAPSLAQGVREANFRRFRIPFLFDLETGTSSRLSDAPFESMGAQPIWVDDETFVLAGVLEPLIGTAPDERVIRAAQRALLAYSTRSKRMTRIARLPAHAVVEMAEWRGDARTLLVTIRSKASRERRGYVLKGERWQRHDIALPPAPPKNPPIQLRVRQSLEERPVLTTFGREGERPVLDPNRWLEHKRLGRVEARRWRINDQLNWEGAIYYPPDYKPGRRYPMLLQTHGFDPQGFSLTGYVNMFPGRALAARGVVVVQIADDLPGIIGTPAEWETARRGYEGVIAGLVDEGLVDQDRVGILGWSRTGSRLTYMLAHSRFTPAASALLETVDYGWWQYITLGATARADQIYGSFGLGDGLENWLENAASFNLERVRTPTLMWDATHPVALWDWYVGLRRLGVPVEYYHSPDTRTHDVYRPDQRLALNTLLIDWFAFWLTDAEDADPQKRPQYARWREFKEQQRSVMLRPRPSLRDWSSVPREEPPMSAAARSRKPPAADSDGKRLP
jgi:hypothetical protein